MLHPLILKTSRSRRGFTLVEILLSTTILAIILALMLRVTNQATSTVQLATKKIEAFATGRLAFDIVTQRLSQATLNTYWDYYDANGKRRDSTNSSLLVSANGVDPFKPARYGRASDLQFIIQDNKQSPTYGQEVFFVAPEAYSGNASNYQSIQGLLNACGFFIRFGGNQDFAPGASDNAFQNYRYRYRLMQVMQPTENLRLLQDTSTTTSGKWFSDLEEPSESRYVRPLADNVIAFIAWPRMAEKEDPQGQKLTSNYRYDSQDLKGANPSNPPLTAHQLPPTIQVTMVIIDEPSAQRLENGATAPVEIENALSGLFVNVSQYPEDINKLAEALAAHHIKYQILNTSVVMRESKWSK